MCLRNAAERVIGVFRRFPVRRSSASRDQVPDPTRRDFLRVGSALVGGLTIAAVAPKLTAAPHSVAPGRPSSPHGAGHPGNLTVGDVDIKRLGFDPLSYLTHFDTGVVKTLAGGRTLREFKIVAHDREIEIAPGVFFPAWTFNGTVPGPTLRVREGDRVRVHFVNAATHSHTLHFHGIHTAEMDGVPGVGPGEIPPGGTLSYEFDAIPFGLHLYHCHAMPLKRHIHKGLYGVFIIDPKQGRPPARELVMVMNGFDTNFDDQNDIYAVNTVAFHYAKHPIRVKRNELVRIYLVNLLEFDPINSIHIHANFFHVYRTGTMLMPTDYTDTIMLSQAERAVLEVRFPFTGRFMFHAHKTEFAELGWMGLFEVTENGNV